jgi:lipoprotein Spr
VKNWKGIITLFFTMGIFSASAQDSYDEETYNEIVAHHLRVYAPIEDSDPAPVEEFTPTWEVVDTTVVNYFESVGVAHDQCNYFKLYSEAVDWIHTPYKWAGTTKKGVDCISLVKNLYRSAYNLELTGNATGLYPQCEVVEKNELQEGDFVFFKINKNHVSHVGLYLRDGKFIHASTSRGVIVSDLSESYYHKYYFNGGRLKDAE